MIHGFDDETGITFPLNTFDELFAKSNINEAISFGLT